MKVGFIGLGIMGSRMAKNLVKNAVDVTVFNRSQAPIEALAAVGAKAAASYAATATSKDVVFTMLSTPEVVREVATGNQGFLKQMKPGAIWVDCSTVNPSFSAEMARAASAHGIKFLDAPVAGTLPHAENALLTFFVGGNADDVALVEPFMQYMGQKVLHVGDTTKGAALKMLVNAMLGQSMLIFSETVLLGMKMGISEEFLVNLLPNLVVSAPFTKAKAEMIKGGEYNVMFPLEWMQKDLQLVTQTAYEHDQTLFMANIAKEIFMNAKRKGMARLDFAAVHKYLKEWTD